MSSEGKKKIVVFPATGWQSRAVCQALSQDSEFEVIGIARSPTGPKANAGGIDINKLGITVVKGDFADPEGYSRYLEGAHGIFINTDVWSLFADKQGDLQAAIATELKYGNDLFKECQKAGIKHVVFSGLFEACDIKEGMYCTSAIKLREDLKVSGLPWTVYYSSGYWENLQHLGMIQPQSDGSIKLGLMCPDTLKQQFTSVATVGKFVKTIFDHPEKYLNKEVLNTIEEAEWGTFATRLAALSGKKVITPQITDEVWYSDQMKAGLGPFHEVFDGLYTSYRKAYFPGMTGEEVVPDLPSFEEWARNDPYIKEVFGL